MCTYPDVSRYPAAKKETTKNQPTCPCIPEHGIKEAISFYQGIQKKDKGLSWKQPNQVAK
jgi:hypothetical protein